MLIYVQDQNNVSLFAFADLSCQGGLVSPARSKASSVQDGSKHRFAWDGQSSWNSTENDYVDNDHVYDFYYSYYSYPTIMTVDPSVCNLGKQIKNITDSPTTFLSFVGYYCDLEKVYENGYDEYVNYYLKNLCNFEQALVNDFFRSDLFDGTFFSFVISFCRDSLGIVHNYDYEYINTGPFVTKVEAQPWLMLEFEGDILVTKVFVTTRSDCCALSFSRIAVSVGIKSMGKSEKGELSKNPLCALYDGPPSFLGEIVTITCNDPLIGTFVVIQQNNPLDMPKEMAMQEVEICGEYL